MKYITSGKEKNVLCFELGDDVLVGLLEFAKKNNIQAAWVWMIGSTKELELGFYDIKLKEYQRRKFEDAMEIINISGNIGTFENKPVCHLHGSFAGRDYKLLGGHIHKLVANATVEVFVNKIEGSLVREYNGEIGLNLLKSQFKDGN